GVHEFGLRRSLALLLGPLLVIEGLLQRVTGRAPGTWAALSGSAPGGTAAAATIALLFMASLLAIFRAYLVDDSFITFRFARNLAEGHGVTWNPGEPPVEGYSNFLWMILSAGALRAGLDPLLVARLLAIASDLLAALAVYRLARSLSGSAPAARLSLIVFAAVPAFALWTMSGLETALTVLLALTFFLACAREFPGTALPWRTAACADLLVLARPEAPLFVGLALVPLLLAPAPGRGRWVARFGMLASPVVLAYGVWKWRTFGTIVPNTASAKAQPFAGILLSLEFFALVFPLLAAWAVRMARGTALLVEQQVMAVAAGFLLAALNVRPQVGHDYRFFLPILAPMLALAGIYLTDPGGTPEPRPAASWWRAGAFGLVLAYAILPVFTMTVYADREARGLRQAHFDVGRALARSYGPSDVLAASDCGIIPYLSHMTTIDIWGLTDRRIGTRGFSSAYVLARKPDVIILHSYFPDTFRGREAYDQLLHDAIAGDASYRVAGRWEFYGYWLWVYAKRPLRPSS
ncbi:MAG TPA: hypothetical protein VI792_10565, partial [Candidatus Eisenbacteria bacterium]